MRTVHALTRAEREQARATLQRFALDELAPAELDVELGRWLQHIALLKGDLKVHDFSHDDEATLQAGIAYAEYQIDACTRQLRRHLRAGATTRRELKPDFAAIKYVDLVGLAESLLGQQARTCGQDRYRIRCPFHEDKTPSLIIYPPGSGWWCPVCHRGGQDAASFCAEYFNCSQLEGLRWVEQLCSLPGAA